MTAARRRASSIEPILAKRPSNKTSHRLDERISRDSDAQQMASGFHILIVQDEPLASNIIGTILETEYRVTVASTSWSGAWDFAKVAYRCNYHRQHSPRRP